MKDNAPITATELAAALGRSPSYVHAMRKAGYVFLYRLTTTVAHAKAWLADHPDFKCTKYFHPNRLGKKARAALAAAAVAAA